jgi:GAF domain-containing protein
MTTGNTHHSTLTDAEKRASNFETVLRVSKTIASSLDLDHILSATCRAAVERFGISHSSLVLLSHARDQGKVRAEYPEIGARDLVIQFAGTPDDKQLGMSTEPSFIPDVRSAAGLEAIRKYMLDFNIQSLLIVPVVGEDEVLGYFSLDSVDHTHTYTGEEIELCRILASQVAVAIKYAQLYEETKQRAEELEALRRTMVAVTSRLDRDALLSDIVEQAVGLLRAKSGGIFEYYPEHRELTVIIDSSDKNREGITIREGEGMAGQLVLSGEPHMIVDNYKEWPGHVPVYDERPPSGAVLEVPLKWQNQIIGILYVEDEVPRKFTEKDALLLKLFADRAAISAATAMDSEKLDKQLRERQDNLASLDWAAKSLSGNLEPERVLQRIAEQARRSLGGDSATIWPYDKGLDEFFPADLVTVGIPEAELQEFRGQNPPPGGISRAVMREGWLPVEDVARDAANYEFMKNTPRTELLIKMGIKSFQGVALKVGNEPVGVMYLNYNRPRHFTVEDRNSMEALAEQAAFALVIVRYAQLEERKQRLREQEALVELYKQLLGTVERDKILQCAVTVARRVLKTDCCNIVLPDRERRLLFVAEEGWEHVEVGKTEMGRGLKSQTGYIIEERKPSRVYDYEKQTEFDPPKEIELNRIKSGMGVPMFRESEVIGAMLVHMRKHRFFTEAEENLLSLIAYQTGIALHSAEQIKRQHDYLSALLSASTSISRSGLNRAAILNEIVKQAYLCFVSPGEQKTTLSTLQLYDEATKTMFFETAYPFPYLQQLKDQFGERRLIRRGLDTRIGIVGRAALSREPQLVSNVLVDPDYYKFLDSTRSEVAVPLLDGGKVLGVLDVESGQTAAFDELHVKELEALAEIAVIAIRNAEQYEELQKTRKTAEASTALALMGMASGVWAHSIRSHANNIRELTSSMRRDLALSDDQLSGMREEFDEKLARLKRQATKILERPLADPLLSERGVGNFSIREILEQRISQLPQKEDYRQVRVAPGLDAVDKSIAVRCNPEWLKRALDIVFDNAVKAMKDVEPARRVLAVSAEVVGDVVSGKMVQIAVTDKGPGIPLELQDKFLKTRIDTTGDESRSGVGLLMARTIIEAYGGSIELKRTGDEGTTIVMKLPISEN